MTLRRMTVSLLTAGVLVLGIASAAVAGAPGPAYLTGGSSTGKHVFDIGDSITELTAPDLTRSLGRYSYVIDATVGITMARSLPTIQDVVTTTPAQDWIIELGTNDRANPNAQQDFTNEVSAVSGQRCVVLVTTSPFLGSIETGLNQRMWALAASSSRFHVLDWGNIEYQNRAWVSGQAVHPSKKGEAKLASLERWALKAECHRS